MIRNRLPAALRRRAVLVLIVAVIVSTAIFAYKVHHRIQHGEGLHSTDARYHERLADRLLDGGSHQYAQPPFYTWYFVISKAAFGVHWATIAVAIQHLLVIVSALLAGRMTARVLGPVAGTVVASALVLSPHLINQASQLRPEMHCMFFVTLALFFLTRPERRPRDLVVVAIAMAAASHVRNSVLGVAAGIGLWLFLLDPVPGEGRWRMRFSGASLFSAVFLVLLVPWSAVVTYHRGKPAIIADNVERTQALGTTKNEYTAVEELPGLRPEPGVLPYLNRRLRAFWPLYFPLPFSKLTSRASWLLMQAPLWLLTPGLVLAIIGTGGFRRSRLVGACAFPALFYSVALSLVYVRVRYRFPVDPGLYAAGLWGWWTFWQRRRHTTPPSGGGSS